MQKAENSIEILAPVGSEEMLKAAVYSGANAVYLGYSGFNARKTAGNFDGEALALAVEFCHGCGVKVHVALNTIVYKGELPQLAKAIEQIYTLGADAVIVQDLATARLVKSIAPGLLLHASTQLAVYSLSGAKQLAQMGFNRVILARELSRAEIQYITQNCEIETEVFVHGALCMGVSGQCYLSAFLGGRSGNRGECAGPCRLPFSVCEGIGAVKPHEGEYHLSLKDQSLVKYLPELAQMGVSSAKIEGRLRSPEYVAAAVNACRCAINKTQYDEKLLQDVFSRSGFTDAYFKGKTDGSMFGVRLPEDTALTKAAQPKLRMLYRRVMQTVPVDIYFKLTENQITITATDGIFNACVTNSVTAQPAKSESYAQAVTRSLGKTGGTPFIADDIKTDIQNNLFVPLGEINELRKQVLDKLLQMRSKQKTVLANAYTLPSFNKRMPQTNKKTFAAFNSPADIPMAFADKFDKILLPLSCAKDVCEDLRSKTILQLPRGIFGDDSVLHKAVTDAQANGYTCFEANNIGHFYILNKCKVKQIYAGFALNIVNPISAQVLYDIGAVAITLSPEISLDDANYIKGCTGLIAYGHLPLMITRACPRHNVANCNQCQKHGVLRDRKGKQFVYVCRDGIRHIYNPVPLYMGERKKELVGDFAVLSFNYEDKAQIAEICNKYFGGEALQGEFTRGLYYR